MVAAFGALFAYIAASPFVLQNVVGLSPTVYALVFGANAAALILANVVNARLVSRVAPERMLRIGVCALVTFTTLLAAVVLLPGLPAWPLLLLLWLGLASLGLVFGNVSALALSQVRDLAGTGSAFLGSLQFLGGALVAPLVGLAGEADARPMGLVMFVAAVLATLSLFLIAGRAPSR